ncbi:hypothetical protein [Latilactobacillus sakei]|uniref:hypothetical protein n=1 Tax=Latilactobacillus sakei TaxID=1599 RepID=UPI003F53763D
MKLADFKIYQKKTDELNEAKQAVLDAANGLIEAWTWEYTDNMDDDDRAEYEDSEWLEVVNHEKVTTFDDAEEIIVTMSGGMATPDTETIEDYNKALDALPDLKSDLNKIIKIVDELADNGFTPKSISTSRISISTYLTFDIKDYDRLKELYDGAIDFDDIDEDVHDLNEFELRISDHGVGSFFSMDTNDDVQYNDNNAKLDIYNF